MSVNRCESLKNITFNRYSFALSAVTTAALCALKYSRPNSLSWGWPAFTGSATLIVGVGQAFPHPRGEENDKTGGEAPKEPPPIREKEVVSPKPPPPRGKENDKTGSKAPKKHPPIRENKVVSHKAPLPDPAAVAKKVIGEKLKENGLDLESFERLLGEFNELFDTAKNFESLRDDAQARSLFQACRDMEERQLHLCSPTLAKRTSKFIRTMDLVEIFSADPKDEALQANLNWRFPELLSLDLKYALQFFLAMPEIPTKTGKIPKKKVIISLLHWMSEGPDRLEKVQASEHWNEFVLSACRLGAMRVNTEFERAASPSLISLAAAKVPDAFLALVGDIKSQLDVKEGPVADGLNKLQEPTAHQLTNWDEVMDYLTGKREALVNGLKLAPPEALSKLKLPCANDLLASFVGAREDHADASPKPDCTCKIHTGVADAFTYAVYFTLQENGAAGLEAINSGFAKRQYDVAEREDPVEYFCLALAKLDIHHFAGLVCNPQRKIEDERLAKALEYLLKKYRKENKPLFGELQTPQRDQLLDLVLKLAEDSETEVRLPLIDLFSDKANASHDTHLLKALTDLVQTRGGWGGPENKELLALLPKLRMPAYKDEGAVQLIEAGVWETLPDLGRLLDDISDGKEMELRLLETVRNLDPTDDAPFRALIKTYATESERAKAVSASMPEEDLE